MPCLGTSHGPWQTLRRAAPTTSHLRALTVNWHEPNWPTAVHSHYTMSSNHRQPCDSRTKACARLTLRAAVGGVAVPTWRRRECAARFLEVIFPKSRLSNEPSHLAYARLASCPGQRSPECPMRSSGLGCILYSGATLSVATMLYKVVVRRSEGKDTGRTSGSDSYR